MNETPKPAAATATATAPAPSGGPAVAPVPPKRSPGHRGADVKDTVAEMAAKAGDVGAAGGGGTGDLMKGFSTYVLTDAGVSATATIAVLRVKPYSIDLRRNVATFVHLDC